jgi:hypothetical protein
MNVFEYMVISVEGLDEIHAEVNKKIKEGWQPIGGISCTAIPLRNLGVAITYSQAMGR